MASTNTSICDTLKLLTNACAVSGSLSYGGNPKSRINASGCLEARVANCNRLVPPQDRKIPSGPGRRLLDSVHLAHSRTEKKVNKLSTFKTCFCFLLQNYQIKESYADKVGQVERTYNTQNKETTYPFRYRKFNTTYTYIVRTKYSDGSLGAPVHCVITTGPFTAPVKPLTAVFRKDNATLKWFAPPQIAAKDLKVGGVFFPVFVCHH